MRATVLYRPGDVCFEERDAPTIVNPADAIIRLSATCVCGSDLWPYRGANPITQPLPMGHEYCGFVEEVGSAVQLIKPGQFVIGSFFASDNTCAVCQSGYQTSCQHMVPVVGAQAPVLRVPLADGTLVAPNDAPSSNLIPNLLALSDVMGTGWFAADVVLECVGTQESMMQAIRSARPGGYVSYVGVPHGVELNGQQLFFAHVHLHGGPAPVRRFLPKLIDLVYEEKINPGKVFDLTLPLDRVAEGYRTMDERRAIKTLLRP